MLGFFPCLIPRQTDKMRFTIVEIFFLVIIAYESEFFLVGFLLFLVLLIVLAHKTSIFL